LVVFKNIPQVKGIISKTSLRMLKENKTLTAFLASAHSTLAGTSEVASEKDSQTSMLVPTKPRSGPCSVKRGYSPAVVSIGSLSYPPSCSSNSSSSAMGKAEPRQRMEPDVVHFSFPNTPAEGFEFHFSREGLQTTWVPKDRKEELALKLVQRLGEVKLEVQVWTDWANERVMQSTNRLVNERTVLFSLKKDKADFEEPNVFIRKRLEETQRAIDSTSCELDRVNSLVQELTDKISLCRREKKAVQLQGEQSDASLASILSKKTEAMNRLKSMETEKILLQEEIAAERNKLSKLLQSLEQARRHEDVLTVFQFDQSCVFKFSVVMYTLFCWLSYSPLICLYDCTWSPNTIFTATLYLRIPVKFCKFLCCENVNPSSLFVISAKVSLGGRRNLGADP
jgi:hypothetical protein